MGLKRRLSAHLCYPRQCPNHPVSKWITELSQSGLKPSIWTIEISTRPECSERETYWIRFFRDLGTLRNISDGNGSLGLKLGPPCLENRLKTIERNKRGHSDASKERMRKAKLGKKQSASHVSNWMSSRGFAVAQEKFRKCNELRQKRVIGSDGTVFVSIRAACRNLGYSFSSLKESIANGWRVRGRTWKILDPEQNIKG